MEAENCVVYNCSERQVIEKLCEVNPDIRISVLSEALIVEAINLRNLTHLVVTPKNSKSVVEPDFEGDEKSYSFYRVISSVNIVAHEDIIRVWTAPANFE